MRINQKMAFLVASLSLTIAFTACGPGSSTGKTSDTASTLTPTPDNNSATNPSSADTNYQKKDSSVKTNDSSKMK